MTSFSEEFNGIDRALSIVCNLFAQNNQQQGCNEQSHGRPHSHVHGDGVRTDGNHPKPFPLGERRKWSVSVSALLTMLHFKVELALISTNYCPLLDLIEQDLFFNQRGYI